MFIPDRIPDPDLDFFPIPDNRFQFYPFEPDGDNAALQHFPDHHEGHLSLLRASLVNNRSVLSI
jgi:hypothetical protein